jgi:hypothetical protein
VYVIRAITGITEGILVTISDMTTVVKTMAVCWAVLERGQRLRVPRGSLLLAVLRTWRISILRNLPRQGCRDHQECRECRERQRSRDFLIR